MYKSTLSCRATVCVLFLALSCVGGMADPLAAATVTEDTFDDVTGVTPTANQKILDNPPNNIMHTCGGAKLILDKQNGGNPQVAVVYITTYIWIDAMGESAFYHLDTFSWEQAEEGKKTHQGQWSVAKQQAVGEHWYKGKKAWQRQPPGVFPAEKGAKETNQINYEIVEVSAGDPSFLQGDRQNVFYGKHDRR